MKQNERHWKSFVVAEDRRSLIYYFEEGNLLQSKPKRRDRGGLLGAQLISFSNDLTQKLLPFDSLVVCFELNVGVRIRK